MKLNGVIVPLEGPAAVKSSHGGKWSAEGVSMTVRPLGEDAGWRSNAELVFVLDKGLTVGYRGFWSCVG